MRAVSLGIDFSNMCFRALFTCKYNNAEDISTFDTEKECAIFARKVVTDITSLIKLFAPNKAYLMIDSKNPWRSDVCKDYKGTRKKDENLNMKNIFKTMGELLDILESRGFLILQAERGEADDMAALLKAKIQWQKNESVIFVTSDADWHQLVDFDMTTKQYFCVYNPIVGGKSITKFYCTEGFYNWAFGTDVNMDIFCDYTNTKRKISEARAMNPKMTFVQINPTEVLINKLLLGDDGDNVPTFYYYYGKTGKKVRLTENKLNKVKEICGDFKTLNELNEVIRNGSFVDALGKVFKQDTSSLDGNIRLNEQRLYVELNPSLFPKRIIEGFEESYNKAIGTPYMGLPKRTEDVVKGTKFEKVTHTANGAKLNKIFAGFIDKPIPNANELF